MEKIKTGILEFDEMLNGGLPKNRHIGFYGGPGTGKTTFTFEILYKGALMGETGYYFTLEEPPEFILEHMKSQFSEFKDIDKLVNEKKLIIEKNTSYNVDSIVKQIETSIVENNVSRMVIDSITIFKSLFNTDAEYRKSLIEFLNLLRTLDVTVFPIIEAATSARESFEYSIEHYVLDGVINLYNIYKGETRIRALEIYKLRGTPHNTDIVPYRVTPRGLKIYLGEKLF
jgi:KaiC/GvpD/RAD55 family RecA-like ATPase